MSFLRFDEIYNCLVFHTLNTAKQQQCCSSNPWSLGLRHLCACFLPSVLDREGMDVYFCSLQLPRPSLCHALGEKRLLSWTLTDCSSRLGNLNSILPVSGGPYLVAFNRPDVTLTLPASAYNIYTWLWFSSPKWEESEYMWALRFRSEGTKAVFVPSGLTPLPAEAADHRQRTEGTRVDLLNGVNGIFSCEISIPPWGHCCSGFWATLLWYLHVGDFTLEKSLWQQNHLPPRRRCQSLKIWDILRQDSNLITAWNKIHPRWKCPLLELKSSQNGFSFPFVFEAKQLLFFFFKEKKCANAQNSLLPLSFIWNWT